MIESVRDGICHVSIIQICLPHSNLTAAMIFDVSHVRIVQVVEHATILKVLNSIGIGIENENNTILKTILIPILRSLNIPKLEI